MILSGSALPLYAPSLTAYERRLTRVVNIGDLPLGGTHPIRVQSMTTADTMNTQATVDESIRMIEAGCELVRITAPSINEANNLAEIKRQLRMRGYTTPLVADIHFTPNAAEMAARLVEKVRINPGNYADRKRFEHIDYTEASYAAELERIRGRFLPLLKICKEYGTAMRIGTNHGSLSDRILSRYGDTPLGMVESALEFIRICEAEGYYNIVVSMKSSNPQVMVQAYRLLVAKLQKENLQAYPLHLGVTEAGDGEDGRIKSAAGIGTLLEDGLGDTIRVSLTEDPVAEMPVARALADRYSHREGHGSIAAYDQGYPINPYHYQRRQTQAVHNMGGGQVPRVIADLSRVPAVQMADLKAIGHYYLPEPDKWKMTDLGADYIYSGSQPIPFMVANGSREIRDYSAWLQAEDRQHIYPLIAVADYLTGVQGHAEINFISAEDTAVDAALIARLRRDATAVLLLHTQNEHAMPALRRAVASLLTADCHTPVIIHLQPQYIDQDRLPLFAATDAGGLLIDGLGDGIMLGTSRLPALKKPETLALLGQLNSVAFNILQAARTRMSKTEYISCPSCGRTLFDLQETTAMIRKRTDHLKGVKIGIMGCIVNGPGEMADADYGYVGVGKDKISLYRGQEVVKKFVPASQAVDELINLIREDGRWNEPEAIEEVAQVG